jgi:hypothetical protein
MLLPDEGISGDPEQRLEVVRTHWAQFEELSTKQGLSIE